MQRNGCIKKVILIYTESYMVYLTQFNFGVELIYFFVHSSFIEQFMIPNVMYKPLIYRL